MSSFIVLFVFLIVGYIAINYIFKSLLSKINFINGIEYIFLGIILSPSFSNYVKEEFIYYYPNVFSFEIANQLAPLIILAIGFVGFVYGVRFNFREIHKYEAEIIKLGIYSLLIPAVIISVVVFMIFVYFFEEKVALVYIITAAVTMGIIGGLTSNQIIEFLIKKYSIEGTISKTLKLSTNLNVNFSILVFGIVFGVAHPINLRIEITATEWVLLGLIISFILGFAFFVFLGRGSYSKGGIFITILGIVIFSSGVAFLLNTSALFINFIVGAILSNLIPKYKDYVYDLQKLFPIFFAFLLLVAGLYWSIPSFSIFLVVTIVFLVFKILLSKISSMVVYQLAYDKGVLNKRINTGMVSIDLVAIVMLLDYSRILYNPYISPVVISVVLVSVILLSIWGGYITKNLLIDLGEIFFEPSASSSHHLGLKDNPESTREGAESTRSQKDEGE